MALVPPKPVDLDGCEDAVRDLLVALGQGDKREVMENTPRRVAELFMQKINPADVDLDDQIKTFPNPDRDLAYAVYVTGVHYVSMCEHHLAPAFGVCDVGYLPDACIVGYSKLKKALNYVARQPQLNERILATVHNYIENNLKPHGIAVSLRSVHCCIAERANAPSTELVTVEAFSGAFESSPRWRSDFVAKVNGYTPRFVT